MDAVRDISPLPLGPDGDHLQIGVRARLKVWIDQDLCTGDGLCTDHAPDVFVLLEDGIAYVAENGRILHDPGGAAQLAVVPPAEESSVIHAAAECPGECIFIELEETPPLTP